MSMSVDSVADRVSTYGKELEAVRNDDTGPITVPEPDEAVFDTEPICEPSPRIEVHTPLHTAGDPACILRQTSSV